MFLDDLLGEIKTSWLLFTLLLLCVGQSTWYTPRVGGWMGEYRCVSFVCLLFVWFFVCAFVLFVCCRLFLLLFLVFFCLVVCLFVLLLLGRGKQSS